MAGGNHIRQFAKHCMVLLSKERHVHIRDMYVAFSQFEMKEAALVDWMKPILNHASNEKHTVILTLRIGTATHGEARTVLRSYSKIYVEFCIAFLQTEHRWNLVLLEGIKHSHDRFNNTFLALVLVLWKTEGAGFELGLILHLDVVRQLSDSIAVREPVLVHYIPGSNTKLFTSWGCQDLTVELVIRKTVILQGTGRTCENGSY